MLDNYKIVLNKLGMTQKQFADALCLDAAQVSRIVNGKKEPSDTVYLLMKEKFDLNIEFLKTGEGNIFIDGTNEPLRSELKRQIKEMSKEEIIATRAFIKYLKGLQDEYKKWNRSPKA